MDYSTAQFAGRLGLSRETLRFYEQKGLIAPARKGGSNYRVYSDLDGMKILRLRALQSLQLSLDEIGAYAADCTLEEQDRHLSELEESLEEAMRRLQDRLARVRKTHSFIREALTEDGHIDELETHGIYKLMMLGEGVDMTEDQQEIARQWLKLLPITDIGWEISTKRLQESGGEPVPTRIGLMLLPKYVDEYAFSIRPPVYFFPRGHSIRMMLRTPDPFHVSPGTLEPLFRYAREKGYRIVSNVSGRYSGSTAAHGQVEYCFSARVNVEKM